MNINRENVCSGSGSWAWDDHHNGRSTCTHCNRSKIRVRKDGKFHIHSKKGK